MKTHIDADEIETTRGERLLAVALAAFLLVGLLWAYVKLDDVRQGFVYRDPVTLLSAPDRALLTRYDDAVARARTADDDVHERRSTLVDRREAYRTALDAGTDDPQLKRAYQAAQRRYDATVRDAVGLHAQERRARLATRPADARLATVEREQTAHVEDQRRQDELVTAGLRLLLVLGSLAGTLRLMLALRRRRSRWIVVAYAGVGAATMLALVMAGDYLTELVDPTELGPLVLSLVGTAFTLAAIAALQRYLARRVPARRVRRAECPFCGYPTRGEHCEGCGRAVIAPCAQCAQPRRVGALYCAACGET
jgi:hypothetical protein